MTPFVLLVALLAAAAETQDCHVGCTCKGSSMNCERAGLTAPPVGYWPEVTYMEMISNNVEKLYSYSFSGFPNVTFLDFADNKLKTFDAKCFSPMSLEHLSFHRNLISSLTASAQLPSLAGLSLQANSLTELDPNIFQRIAPNLISLDLTSNDFRLTADKPAINHNMVQYLSLSDIDASDISATTFRGVPNVERLFLIFSKVTDINGVFVELTHLQYLALSGNFITQVVGGALPSSRTLLVLDLAWNPLERLEVSAVSGAMPGGSLLDISETPLACDCSYAALFWWAEGRGVELEADCAHADCAFARAAPPTLPRLAPRREGAAPYSRGNYHGYQANARRRTGY